MTAGQYIYPKTRTCLVFLLVSLVCYSIQARETIGAPLSTVAGNFTAATETVDILNREPVTEKAEVRHVLISWADLSPNYDGRMDERGYDRSETDAIKLASQVLKRARNGEDFLVIMKEHSEDRIDSIYTATPDADLVPPFKALSLRLKIGEIGMVESKFGFHVIKRVN